MPSQNRADYKEPKLGYSGFSVKGLTSSDPANVERNQAAAARYAVQDYQSKGTPIPTNLAPRVKNMIAAGQVPGTNTAAPVTQGTRIAGGQLFLGGNADWNNYTAGLQGADARVTAMNAGVQRTPSPGPNVFAGLGAPGQQSDRRDTPAPQSIISPTTNAENVIPPTGSGDNGIDSGNIRGDEVSRMNAQNSRVPSYEAGGMVGPGGVPQRPSTTSFDLPPALARLLDMPMQSYAEGGMVGPGGVPQRPMTSPAAMQVGQQGGAPIVGLAPANGGQGRPLNFAAIDQMAQQFMQAHPDKVQQIKAEVDQAIASGDVDAAGINTFVQIATVSLQDPAMWPQMRQTLIRQGLLEARDISEEYDQGFLIVLYIIGKTMGNVGAQTTPTAPAQGASQQPMSAGQAPQMSMASGGALPGKSDNPDGSIPINAHEGEYVIPADVTRKLGTDHFDKMIAKARGADSNGDK